MWMSVKKNANLDIRFEHSVQASVVKKNPTEALRGWSSQGKRAAEPEMRPLPPLPFPVLASVSFFESNLTWNFLTNVFVLLLLKLNTVIQRINGIISKKGNPACLNFWLPVSVSCPLLYKGIHEATVKTDQETHLTESYWYFSCYVSFQLDQSSESLL